MLFWDIISKRDLIAFGVGVVAGSVATSIIDILLRRYRDAGLDPDVAGFKEGHNDTVDQISAWGDLDRDGSSIDIFGVSDQKERISDTTDSWEGSSETKSSSSDATKEFEDDKPLYVVDDGLVLASFNYTTSPAIVPSDVKNNTKERSNDLQPLHVVDTVDSSNNESSLEIDIPGIAEYVIGNNASVIPSDVKNIVLSHEDGPMVTDDGKHFIVVSEKEFYEHQERRLGAIEFVVVFDEETQDVVFKWIPNFTFADKRTLKMFFGPALINDVVYAIRKKVFPGFYVFDEDRNLYMGITPYDTFMNRMDDSYDLNEVEEE